MRLSVIFVQDGNPTSHLAFKRLLSLVGRLDTDSLALVVLDNVDPGVWFHEISDTITHVGGDSSSREFSAFDKGLDYLDVSGKPGDVYMFVTDAFLAHGEDFLGLIDDSVIRWCFELGSCIGWVDRFEDESSILGHGYREWMRTSLFLVPAAKLPRVKPLDTPFDEQLFFSSDPEAPFLDSAPLGRPLQHHLLAWLARPELATSITDQRHSPLDLCDDSFDLFQARARSVIKEHALSARLQASGVPCFDFRFIKKIADRNFTTDMISDVDRARFQWSGWQSTEAVKPPRFTLESYTAPQTMRHGEPAELRLVGWVLAEPQVKEVFVRLSDREKIGGRCDIVREDVLAAFPGFSDGLCGFDIRANLDCLFPGSYEVEWVVPEASLSETLGRIRVLPRCDFRVARCFVPDFAARRRKIPISLDGTLECSSPLQEIEVLWDGEETKITPDVVEVQPRANSLLCYRIAFIGEAMISRHRSLQHQLELVFHTEDGGSHRWCHYAAIKAATKRPHSLSLREIGELNPRTGRVRVHLRGVVQTDDSADRLLLLREEQCLLEESLSAFPERHSLIWFEIERDVGEVPPGSWNFQLALKREGGPPEILSRWRDQVKLIQPRVTMDLLELRPYATRLGYALAIAGWVENHFVIDKLILELDDRQISILAIDQMRPDIAEHLGQPLIRQQGFCADVFLEVPPGEHMLRLLTEHREERKIVWERRLAFEELGTAGFLLSSTDLEELESEAESIFWSSIRVRGSVTTRFDELVATLYVGSSVADRQLVASEKDFLLRYRPEESGTYSIRVVLDSLGRTLYDSGYADVSFLGVDVPVEAAASLERFMKTFQIEAISGTTETEDLLRSLLEKEREGISDYLQMLRDIDRSLETKKRSPPSRSPARAKARRLKILFASWEVPCLRHGGGVWMSNLLRCLSERHEITLLHGYSPEEAGWVDDVRPYVSRVVSVPRTPQLMTYYGEDQALKYVNDCYVPGLRAAVESEVLTGAYDLVDYEYVRMYLHRSKAGIPQVVSVLEEGFSARLASQGQDLTSNSAKIDLLDCLLRSFYFSAVSLPDAFRHLIAVTEEDAHVLRDFQSGSEVYVNGIGVDVERFDRTSAASDQRQGDPPALVFLGNYRHPPNVEAATLFAERVMPGIWSRFPQVEFQIVGSHPTPRLRDLGRAARISVTGFVEDLRPYLWQASAVVAPIFTGAGMRVKLLEAMAAGAPLIGTGLAMHGIGAVDGQHYFGAETVSQFVEASCRCIEHPEEAERIGRAGAELIAEKHSFEKGAEEREAIWYRVIESWEKG